MSRERSGVGGVSYRDSSRERSVALLDDASLACIPAHSANTWISFCTVA